MSSLIDTLQKYPIFLEQPLEQQHVLLTLAQEFEENELAIYLSPRELAQKLRKGSPDLWQLFLNFEPTKHYIKREMGARIEIEARKSFHTLAKAAKDGDTQAAKQIQQMATNGNGDDKKVVVLHRVVRSKPKEEVEQ